MKNMTSIKNQKNLHTLLDKPQMAVLFFSLKISYVFFLFFFHEYLPVFV